MERLLAISQESSTSSSGSRNGENSSVNTKVSNSQDLGVKVKIWRPAERKEDGTIHRHRITKEEWVNSHSAHAGCCQVISFQGAV